MSYNPNNLIDYITGIINTIIHDKSIGLNKIRFDLQYHYNTAEYIVLRFNFLYKRKVDLPAKINQILSKSEQINKIVNKGLFGRIFRGLNGSYYFYVSNNPLVNRTDGLFLIVNTSTAQAITNTYFSLLPLELINLVYVHLDTPSIEGLNNSNILPEYFYTENNYTNLLILTSYRLYQDLKEIKEYFPSLKFTYKEIYNESVEIDLDSLYDNKKSNGEIITLKNLNIEDFTKVVKLNDGILEEKQLLRNLIYSLRIKVLLTELYYKLLTFAAKYNNNIKDYINMMNRALYTIIYDNKRFTERLISGSYINPRPFPVGDDFTKIYINQDDVYLSRYSNMIGSGLLLYFYLNIDKVIVSDIFDIHIFVNILSSLYKEIDFNLWIHKINNDMLKLILTNPNIIDENILTHLNIEAKKRGII